MSMMFQKHWGFGADTMFTAVNKNNELMHRRFSEVSSVFTTRLHTLNGLFSLCALTRFIRKIRISHLMIHIDKIAALSILLKKLTGVRLMFVKHNVVANKTDFYHRLIQKNTDRFICVSCPVYDVQTADNPFKEKYRLFITVSIPIGSVLSRKTRQPFLPSPTPAGSVRKRIGKPN